MVKIGTESMLRAGLESVLIHFFISYFRIIYVVSENLTHVEIKMTSEYIQALERATEICPQQRICGGHFDAYSEDPILLQLYEDAMERQEQKSQSSDNNSCCYPCSCEEDCIVTQTCCPDTFSSTNLNISSEYSLSCSDSYTWLTTEQQLLVEQNKIPDMMYSRLSRCPFSTEEQLRMQCVFNSEAETFNDQVMMEVVQTRHPVHNRYCALCNNITDVQRYERVINKEKDCVI